MGFLLLLAATLPQPAAAQVDPFEEIHTASEPAPPPEPIPTPESLQGMWKLNAAKSDSPEEKMKGSNQLDLSDSGDVAGLPVRSGRRRGEDENAERAAEAGPLGGPISTAGNAKDREKTLALIRPSDSLTVSAHGSEFDLTDDQGHKLVLFTDGRKLPKPKSGGDQEMDAVWTPGRAGNVSYDEKGARGEPITFTFQFSFKTNQLTETVSVDNSRVFAPVMIHYVYDPASPQTSSSN